MIEIYYVNPIIISNSKIRRLILAGAVSVNGRSVTRPAFELRGRSNVLVLFDSDKFFYEKQPEDAAFEMSDDAVLYEDDNLIFALSQALLSLIVRGLLRSFILFIVDSFSDFFVNFAMQKSIKALSKSSPPKYELPYANLTLHVMESLFFVNSKTFL